MIDIINESVTNSDKILMDLFNLFSSMSEEDESMISNVHSIDPSMTENGYKNVAFDYDVDVRVMLNIHPNGDIEIIAPASMITGTESLIESELDYWDGDFIVKSIQ